jgi:dipeptidyl aminopeptidase/acylaminoacyl peptidase
MVHGAKDIMVPVENADAYRKLVQPINPALEWLQYPNEGHELRSLPNIVNFYNRMAQFLDKHLAV